MLLPHATWRASEGHFVRALQACVHYFSAYPRRSVFSLVNSLEAGRQAEFLA
jgi:hypothetical protein